MSADRNDSVRRTDPLIAHPAVPTGHTGEMPRPGEVRSPWVIGLLLAAFASLISGLVTVAVTRGADDSFMATEQSAATAEVSVAPLPAPAASSAGAEVGADAVAESPEQTDTAADAVAESGTATSGAGEVDEADDEPLTSLGGETLPAPGNAIVVGTTVAIASSCEGHLPFAPAETDLEVSSYVVRIDEGAPLVIDRRLADGADSVSIGSTVGESVVVDPRSGAFVARVPALAGGADESASIVAVNPDPIGGLECGDTLVTNEPGQIAFPHTRVVMVSCASGVFGIDVFAAGITSEGGEFTAWDNADGTVVLSYVDPDVDSALLDAAASAFEVDDRLGFSGVVTNGAVTLDIAIDVTPERGRPCTETSSL